MIGTIGTLEISQDNFCWSNLKSSMSATDGTQLNLNISSFITTQNVLAFRQLKESSLIESVGDD